MQAFSPPRAAPSPPLPPAAVHYVLGLAGRVQSLLEGSPRVDPMQFGWTTEEERGAGGAGNVSCSLQHPTRLPRVRVCAHHALPCPAPST